MNYYSSVYFQVPHDFNFIQAIDLLFKVHILFGCSFDSSLENMFNFLQYFVYGLNKTTISPSNGMKAVFNRLLD